MLKVHKKEKSRTKKVGPNRSKRASTQSLWERFKAMNAQERLEYINVALMVRTVKAKDKYLAPIARVLLDSFETQEEGLDEDNDIPDINEIRDASR